MYIQVLIEGLQCCCRHPLSGTDVKPGGLSVTMVLMMMMMAYVGVDDDDGVSVDDDGVRTC